MATFKKLVDLGERNIAVELGEEEITIDLTYPEIRECTTRGEKIRMVAELYNEDPRAVMQELIMSASTEQYEPLLVEDGEHEATISLP